MEVTNKTDENVTSGVNSRIQEMASSSTVSWVELKTYLSTTAKDDHLTPKTLGMIFEKFVGIGATKKGHENTANTRWVDVDELVDIHRSFKTSNGSSWARADRSYLGNKYHIERKHVGRSLSAIRLKEPNGNKLRSKRQISNKIRKQLANQPCVFCGRHHNLEVDHKDGRYDNENNASTKTQRLEDFQSLCKGCNDLKREECKRCRQTGERFDATSLHYPVSWTSGGKEWDEGHGCKGCYWYDIEKFRSALTYCPDTTS